MSRTILLKIFFILSVSLSLYKCEDITGIRLSINKEFVEEVKNQFLPPIFDIMKNLTIPDQNMNISILIAKIYLSLTNIQIKIKNLITENIIITFNEIENHKVAIELKNVNVNGHFDMKFTFLKYIGESLRIDFNITKFSIGAELELISQESKIDKNKYLPSALISALNIDVDFDFNIQGPFFGKIANLLKKNIKQIIINKIQTDLKKSIIDSTKTYLSDFISNQIVYYNLTQSGLVLDYSLSSVTYVQNGSIIINSYGAIVNREDNQVNFTASLPTIPIVSQNEINDKNILFKINSNCINIVIATLFKDQLMKFTITSDDIPKNFSLQFNTTSLDVFINNLSKVYGKDKKIKNACEVKSLPVVDIVKSNISVNIDLECSLLVNTDSNKETYFENAMTYSFSTSFEGDFKLLPNGIIKAKISTVSFSNSKMIENKVEGAEIEYVEQILDFAAGLVIPFLNNKYLQNLNITLPTLEGIVIDDSSASIEEGSILLQVNPVIPQKYVDYIVSLIQNIFKKRNLLFS